MKHLYSGILLFLTLGLQGQSLSPYASIEENMHFTDIPRTEGAIGLSDLASNPGLRLGAYYTYNNLPSGEITLGVIGIGTPNVFSNTIVPVEIVGHYNIFNGKDKVGGLGLFSCPKPCSIVFKLKILPICVLCAFTVAPLPPDDVIVKVGKEVRVKKSFVTPK